MRNPIVFVLAALTGCAFQVSPTPTAQPDGAVAWQAGHYEAEALLRALHPDGGPEPSDLDAASARDPIGPERDAEPPVPIDSDGGAADSGSGTPDSSTQPLDAGTAADSGPEPLDLSHACQRCDSDELCGDGLRCAGADGRDEQCLGAQCTNLRRCVVVDTADQCEAAFGTDHHRYETTGLCAPYPAYRCPEPGPNCQPTSWSTWCDLWLMDAL